MTATNRVALVTGGGRGIGRGAALALAARGWSLMINYRSDEDSARRTAEEALSLGSPNAQIAQGDVSLLQTGEALVDWTQGSMGGFDLLVSNAGAAPKERADLLETTPEAWDFAMGTNLRGAFFLAQAAAKVMLNELEEGRGGPKTMVFIGSVSAEMASVNRGEYCVAKAGLSMVARLFAVRLAGQGIRVFEVRPGIVATDMTAIAKALYDERIAAGLVPMGRWGQPEEIGRAVAALADDALPYATGSVIVLDGGMGLPRL